MLYLDLETYNEQDISVGPYRYAETAEVLLFAYAFGDGPVRVWDRTQEAGSGKAATGKQEQELFPSDLWNWLNDDHVLLTAHNAMFDRTVLAHALGIPTRLERWHCTMAKALSHAFPGSLEACGAVLGLPGDKAKLADGKKLINRFCKPAPANHKADRYDHTTHPDEWQRFRDYAAQDIEAMREIDKRLPPWNWKDSDIALYHLDQRINDRGFRVDRELVGAGSRAAIADRTRMAAEFRELTGGAVDRPTQRDRFCAWLNTHFDLGIDNTRAETFRELLEGDQEARRAQARPGNKQEARRGEARPGNKQEARRGEARPGNKQEAKLDPVCRRLMEISILSNKTSTAKYATLLPAVSSDGRFRGGLQFRGAARTRRWAGRTFQPQNLPSRGLPAQRSVDTYIRALKAGTHEFLFDDLMVYASAALRGVVIAPEGRELAIADLSNIEGRILAWLAGETWKIKAFFDHDAGKGPDLYNITATSILGGDPYQVPKATRNVFGKVPDLACGYEGGYGAFETFCKAYGVLMADHDETIRANVDPKYLAAAKANYTRWGEAKNPEADRREWLARETVKLAWRGRHPKSRKLWKACREAAKAAILNPGKSYRAGSHLRFAVKHHAGNSYLLCRLPSGNFLCYFAPRYHESEDAITYKQAGIEDIASHSVRKWLATKMADQGANEFELMAWFGWSDPKEARPYVERVNRLKLAQKAGEKVQHVTAYRE